MIIFDLKCEKDHKFEGWFKDRNVFENQKSQKIITCPLCGSSEVEIIPSIITIMGKDIRTSGRENIEELSIPKVLRKFNEYLNKNFDDVGDKFFEMALKIHHGEEKERNIKGTTTESEEETLRDEGVQFFKVPVTKFDN